jgi:hypothetical protein
VFKDGGARGNPYGSLIDVKTDAAAMSALPAPHEPTFVSVEAPTHHIGFP